MIYEKKWICCLLIGVLKLFSCASELHTTHYLGYTDIHAQLSHTHNDLFHKSQDIFWGSGCKEEETGHKFTLAFVTIKYNIFSKGIRLLD